MGRSTDRITSAVAGEAQGPQSATIVRCPTFFLRSAISCVCVPCGEIKPCGESLNGVSHGGTSEHSVVPELMGISECSRIKGPAAACSFV